MYPNSIYFGLKVVPIWVLLGPKYILFGYMDPLGFSCDLGGYVRAVRCKGRVVEAMGD